MKSIHCKETGVVMNRLHGTFYDLCCIAKHFTFLSDVIKMFRSLKSRDIPSHPLPQNYLTKNKIQAASSASFCFLFSMM